jgi:hypothetical protein
VKRRRGRVVRGHELAPRYLRVVCPCRFIPAG